MTIVVLAACGSGSSGTARPSQAALAGRIVFIDRPIEPGPAHVFTIAADGSQRELVTNPPAASDGDHNPKLSPDGTKILFYRLDSGDNGNLMVVDVDGVALRALTLGCTAQCMSDANPAWSPDGSGIAYERAVGPTHDNGIPRFYGIWVANVDGTNPHQLTQLEPDSGWEDHSPSYSPNGRQLLFMRSGNRPENRDRASIWTMDVDGKNPRLVYRLPDDRPGGGGYARWSPDGSRILFSDASAFVPIVPPLVPQVFTIRPDGTELRQLTHGSEGGFHPAWSPDGDWIVFLRQVGGELKACPGGRNELYVMRANGSDIRRITKSTADECHPNHPDWGV